jgi:hypothetical protein
LPVERPSDLGVWSYEVVDTKLARKVKTAALVQMSNYSEQLYRVQGTYPKEMHVASISKNPDQSGILGMVALRGIACRLSPLTDSPWAAVNVRPCSESLDRLQ